MSDLNDMLTSDSEDEDLPFEMDAWEDEDEAIYNSRPDNPMPKILEENSKSMVSSRSGIPMTPVASGVKRERTISIPASTHKLQKVSPTIVNPAVFPPRLASSGERWEFQGGSFMTRFENSRKKPDPQAQWFPVGGIYSNTYDIFASQLSDQMHDMDIEQGRIKRQNSLKADEVAATDLFRSKKTRL